VDFRKDSSTQNFTNHRYAKHSRPRDRRYGKTLLVLRLSKRMAQKKKALWSKGSLEKQRAKNTEKTRLLDSNRICQRGDRLYSIPHATAVCSPGRGTARRTHRRHFTQQSGDQPGGVEPGAIEEREKLVNSNKDVQTKAVPSRASRKRVAHELRLLIKPRVAKTSIPLPKRPHHSGLACPKSTLPSLDAPKHSCADPISLLHRFCHDQDPFTLRAQRLIVDEIGDSKKETSVVGTQWVIKIVYQTFDTRLLPAGIPRYRPCLFFLGRSPISSTLQHSCQNAAGDSFIPHIASWWVILDQKVRI
jgi:hypothetical protein